jgi:hypothetical protein
VLFVNDYHKGSAAFIASYGIRGLKRVSPFQANGVQNENEKKLFLFFSSFRTT